MSRSAVLLAVLVGLAVPFAPRMNADDGNAGSECKKGWHMCWCKRDGRARKQCETDEICKACGICWGDIAQYQCLKGEKYETMNKVFEEAKKTNKLVLYIGNTGG